MESEGDKIKHVKYQIKDISVVIPTYNRLEELEETIRSFNHQIKKLKEIVIVDQSKNDSIEKAIKRKKNKKFKYLHFKVPSLTRARNKGIVACSNKSKIIAFLDDDVTLEKDYFEKMLEVFNKFPDAIGVSGYYLPKELAKVNKIDNFMKKLFFVEHLEKNSCKVMSAYGAIFPSKLDKVIEAEWLPGGYTSFKKEVFDKFKFDENLSRYALGEDFEFTYRLQKNHPGKLYMTPYAKLIHWASVKERYPTEKASYMNQINHFYINFKNFDNNFKEKVIFLWALTGITSLRIIKTILGRRKADFLKLKFYLKSLFFVIRNLEDIKKGKLLKHMDLEKY